MAGVKNAADALKVLHGIFCVYKYTDISLTQMKERIIKALVRDLNSLPVRQPRRLVKIEGSLSETTELKVLAAESYADNVLVVGPRHQLKDFSLSWATSHGYLTTGLTVLGIGRYAGQVRTLKSRRLICSYEIEGKFGFVTDNLTETGKILEKSSYKHMNVNVLERILSAVQADHQQIAYMYAGVPLDSQKAYEIASKGLVRPAENSQMLLYGVRCIKFTPPDFTLEVQCINENEDSLKELVHNIGSRSKCWASTCKIRMTRFGPFSLDHALLRKHWTLEHIIDNIELCTPLFADQYTMPDPVHLQKLKEAN